MLLSYPVNSRLAQSRRFRHAACAPMVYVRRRGVQGDLHAAPNLFRRYLELAPRTGSILFQSHQQQSPKAFSPELNRRSRYPRVKVENKLVGNVVG